MSKGGEVLIEVKKVSKKFSKDLKRSLFYGLKDVTSAIFGLKQKSNALRPEEFWAVNNISFELRRGECLGLIGHNGAGKSTLLKILNGLIKPDQGEIIMRGKIGALIELGAGFNPILTGRENIYINGQILGLSKKEVDERMDEIIEFSEIAEFIDSPVQNYSSGMKVRLGFAVAAQMKLDILLIDEVLAVGDVGFRIKCYNKIQQLLKNTAVIFVSHSMPSIGRICNTAILMDHGCLKICSENVSVVVNEYNKLFNSKSNSEMNIFSNGIELTNILLNDKPVGAIDLLFNDELCFQLEIQAMEELNNSLVSLVFIDREEKIIASTNTLNFNLFKGTNNVLIGLKNLFNIGEYAVHIVFSKEEPIGYVTIFRYESAFRLFINNSPIISVSPIILENKTIVNNEAICEK
jgi:lipopolysaccharide transport system ATP-binding protein